MLTEQGFENENCLLFIIGMPRSGTKLLRQLLNQHSRIRIPNIETEFYPFLVRYIDKHGPCDGLSDFLQMAKALQTMPFFIYMREECNAIDTVSWYKACRDYSAAGIFYGLLLSATKSYGSNGLFIGDKSPSYINQLAQLNQSFPKARFIHIVRDARDYSLSINHAWGKNKIRAASRWSDSIGSLIRYRKHIRLHELRYEDLIENPQCELKAICTFLGLPFENGMTNPDRIVENLGDTRDSINVIPANSHKYKRLMTKRCQHKIEKITCEEMRTYDYEIEWSGEAKKPNPLTNMFLQLIDGFNLVRHEKNQRGIFGSIAFYWNYFRATRAL
ncbi:MAG: sulfotransferase [Halioglobus sp.]|nr:sulfotransferase [Halioglobus sp.]